MRNEWKLRDFTTFFGAVEEPDLEENTNDLLEV